MPNILQSIAGMVSPREAEAKVTPLDSYTAEAIKIAEDQSSVGLNPFTKLLYNAIVNKAKDEEKNVDVTLDKVLGATGQYDPKTSKATLSQSYYKDVDPANPAVQNTLSHELLHFLLGAYGKGYREDNTLRSFRDIKNVENINKEHDLGQGMRNLSQDTAKQHKVIEYILGNNKAPEFTPLAYQALKPLMAPSKDSISSDVIKEVFQRLFSGTPLQQGVIQAEPIRK